jgi:hypothetical protein
VSTPTEFSCASCQSTNLAVNPSEGVYRCANCGFAGTLPGAEGERDSGTGAGALVGTEQQLNDLGEAARRAGTIVTGYIDSIVADAERRAEDIRQAGQRDRQAGARDGERARKAGAHDAERARREAFESASRVFERIQALERPLGELAHTLQVEMDRVGHELEGEAYEETLAISAEADGASSEVEEIHDAEEVEEIHDAEEVPEAEEVDETAQPEEAEEAEEVPEAEEAPKAEEVDEAEQAPEPAQFQETRESERVEEVPEADEAGAAPEPAMFIPGQGPERLRAKGPKEKKPRRWSLRRKPSITKGAFITTEGHCAVCQKTFMAGSQEAFDASGWRANGDVGLCPDCQADSWQLPEGARLPFRRGGV